MAERTRGYVERPAVTDPMLAHALSPIAPNADWGLAVTGESGGGKSSLFGRAERGWWRKAYEQLAGMKRRGIMLPTDEQYLAALRHKAQA